VKALPKKKKSHNNEKITLTVEKALEEFNDVVYRTAYSFAKNEADAKDICQDVFMNFMKYGINKEYDSLDHARHWFIRVTINCHHMFHRARKRREEVEKLGVVMTEKSEQNGVTERVIDAVGELDEKYRVTIHLFFYEGYKIKEIASLLEENENTIKTRLARAKRMLKSKLGTMATGGDYHAQR